MLMLVLAATATADAHEFKPAWGYAFIDDQPFNEPGPGGAELPATQVFPRGAIRDTLKDNKDVRLTVQAFTAGNATPVHTYRVDEGDFVNVPIDRRLDHVGGITQVRFTFCRFNPSNGAIEVCEPALTIGRPPPPPPAPPADRDGDGAPETIDCWDTNATVYPGAPEIPGNGIDDDCAGGDAPGRLSAVIKHEWKNHNRRTRARELLISEAPPGARVEVRCKGKRCPFKRRATTINRKGEVDLRRKFLRKRLRPKLTIEVRLTQPNSIGRVWRFRTQREGTPPMKRLCLPPGRDKPTRC